MAYRNKASARIVSEGPWDNLSMDIIVPLLADCHLEFIIVLEDCFSKNAMLVSSRDHTAITVCIA